MKVSDFGNSRYLRKEDCDPPITVTISHVDQQNVAPAEEKPELRAVLHFREDDIKPMVANPTNGSTIASIVGSDETDDWTGKQIVLYHEPNVSFAGKLVGGIRVRQLPSVTAALAAAETAEPVTDELEDEIPF